jgi:hypothetical protein
MARDHYRLWFALVAALMLLAPPRPVRAEGLEGTDVSPGVIATGDPTGVGLGLQWPSGSVHLAASVEFDHRLFGIAPRVGVRHRWIDGPRYSLDIWSTVGPSIWLRPPFAAGAGAELGLRNVFGGGPVRWSAGASLDSAVELSPVFRGRYRPEAGLGLGLEGETPGLWPDAVWLRGQLGYDFVPSSLGAFHANVWLSVHWSLDWE